MAVPDVKKAYEKDFDAHRYAERYLKNSNDDEHQWFMEDFYHRLFKEGKLRGKTLIDVGCGPTLRAPLVASEYGCEVYCVDFLKRNLDFVNNWMEKGHVAFDFSKQFRHVAQLEGNNEIGYLEERVKKSIKGVMSCDIMADNPLHPRPLQQFDIVTASLCLDCYADLTEYFRGAKGIGSLVRSGGYLAFGSSLGSTGYGVGDKVLPSANANPETARIALTVAGLKVLEVCVVYLKEPVADSDGKGYFTIYAIKP